MRWISTRRKAESSGSGNSASRSCHGQQDSGESRAFPRAPGKPLDRLRRFSFNSGSERPMILPGSMSISSSVAVASDDDRTGGGDSGPALKVAFLPAVTAPRRL